MPLPMVANHWTGHSCRIQKEWTAEDSQRLSSPFSQIMEMVGQIAITGNGYLDYIFRYYM
jgi:hypothetical protein